MRPRLCSENKLRDEDIAVLFGKAEEYDIQFTVVLLERYMMYVHSDVPCTIRRLALFRRSMRLPHVTWEVVHDWYVLAADRSIDNLVEATREKIISAPQNVISEQALRHLPQAEFEILVCCSALSAYKAQ